MNKYFDKFYIGTSGYSFKEWTDVFYPSNLKSNDFFSYYIKHFNTVEINYTYYTFPTQKVFQSLNNKSPKNYKFFVKAHSSMTHSLDASKQDYSNFKESLLPIIETNKLEGILFQFPASFEYNDGNLKYLDHINNNLNLSKAVEFRNKTWINDTTKKKLTDLNISIVSVDEPSDKKLLGSMFLLTNDLLYIRFHSRNLSKWYQGPVARYDYLYNNDELSSWIKIIKKNLEMFKKAFIFFNNCHAGHAVKNAKQMYQILFNNLQNI